MTRLIYDISRLSTRVLNATPNGIDWIDSLLAGHFLAGARPDVQTLLFGFGGPRLFAAGALPNPVETLDRAWGRKPGAGAPDIPDWIVDALTRPATAAPARAAPRRASLLQPERAARVARSFARYGLRAGADPRQAAPQGAIYINASHFPLEWPRHMRWLDERADIRPVVFVHDLLPLTHPDYFWDAEPRRHAIRMAFLAQRGAAAIVGSRTVAAALAEDMRRRGRNDLPIHVAHPPTAPLFHTAALPDPRLAKARYFVACGTIEPRKNHLTLIAAWRRLVARRGADTPKLLLIGKRGWRCDDIVAGIEDPALRGHVIEANRLSSGAYRALLGGALALLSPSLAEGFGLPVAEALCVGTPAIVSDIEPHREQGDDVALYIPPLDADGWVAAIEAYSDPAGPVRAQALGRIGRYRPVTSAGYLDEVEGFLSAL